jgi:hypothetical protein
MDVRAILGGIILLQWFKIQRELAEMRTFHSDKGITSIQVGVAILLVILLFFIGTFLLRREDSIWLKTELEKTTKKTQLVQTMRSELLASAEAEKSSVMADTDEASEAFAKQSMQASQDVEKARLEIDGLIEHKNPEATLFGDFSTCWEKLRAIDKEVLSLAVQNTNLKALRLSFGPAAAAMKHMEGAMNQLLDATASSPNAAGITRLTFDAVTDALNIYTLQAPHIAETSDAEMDRIEASMKQLDEQVQDALKSLDILVGEVGKPLLAEALKSYRDFRAVNGEIIGLSRKNSNLRSFTVSLGQKRNMMAQCLDLLNALQEAVQQSATFKATR